MRKIALLALLLSLPASAYAGVSQYTSQLSPNTTPATTDLIPDCALGVCNATVATTSLSLGNLSTFVNANLPAINLGASGAGGVTGNLPISSLAALGANEVIGALTSTTPSGLAVPSCSASNNALIWTSGTGFGCNTITTSGTPGGSSGQIEWNNAGAFGGFTMSGDATLVASTGVLTLSTVNSNIGTFASTTVNAKGQVTAAGNLTGDVTSSGATTTIANNAVTNAKAATMTANTVKGNFTGSTANQADFAMPSCNSANQALTYTLGTGIGCATIAGSASTAVVYVGTTAGTANAQTIASPNPSGFTLTDQYVVSFNVGAGLANTSAAPTLSVNGTTAEPMDVQSGGTLVSLPIGYLQPANQYIGVFQAACGCYVVSTVTGSSIVQASTSQTPTAAQWAPFTVINLNAASLSVTPIVSTSLSPGGGLIINAINAGTLTATSPDTITTSAGTTGAGGSVSLAAGTTTQVTTDGAGHLYAAGNSTGGGGSGTVSNCSTVGAVAIYNASGTTVSCPSGVGTSGQVLTSNGAGVAPTFQAGGGGGVPALPGYNTAGGVDSNWGYSIFAADNLGSLVWPTTNFDYYYPFIWHGFSGNAVRVSVRIQTFSAPTGSPVLYARIYSVTSTGQPGSCVVDFTPSAGMVPTATGILTTTATGAALTPGTHYFLDLAFTGLTGGTLSLSTPTATYYLKGSYDYGVLGVTTGGNDYLGRATSPTAGACPATANTTGWVVNTTLPPIVGLGSS